MAAERLFEVYRRGERVGLLENLFSNYGSYEQEEGWLLDQVLDELTPEFIEELRRGKPQIVLDYDIVLNMHDGAPTKKMRIVVKRGKLSGRQNATTNLVDIPRALEQKSETLDFVITVDTDRLPTNDSVLSAVAHEVTHISQDLNRAIEEEMAEGKPDHEDSKTEQEANLVAIMALIARERFSEAARYAVSRGPYLSKMMERVGQKQMTKILYSYSRVTPEKVDKFEDALVDVFDDIIHDAAMLVSEPGKTMTPSVVDARLLQELPRKDMLNVFKTVYDVIGRPNDYSDLRDLHYVPIRDKIAQGEKIYDPKRRVK